MEDLIRHIIKEELYNEGSEKRSRIDKLKSMINSVGAFNAMEAIGGYNKFKQTFGDHITKDNKISLIKGIVIKYGHDEGEDLTFLGDNYNTWVELDHNKTDSYDYITEVTQVYDIGFFAFKQYPYDEELEDYDYSIPYNGTDRLSALEEKDIDKLLNLIVKMTKV